MTDSIEQAGQATAGALTQAAKNAVNDAATVTDGLNILKSNIAADDTKAHGFIDSVVEHFNALKAMLATAADHVEGELLEFFEDMHDAT